jgi:phage terminase large subunit GpA-like protein
MNLADGYAAITEACVRGARPDPELRVDEWSEQFMVVPKDAAKPGRYRIAHTPMARRILQVLSPRHPARRVVVKGASQMLKTQVALNWLMASAHRAPANMLVLEPTDSLAKRLSARVQKCIRDVQDKDGHHVLRHVFAAPRSRDSRNTVFAKDFEGGTMYLATAGSAANLAEIPARYVYIDEASRLEESVDGEGDVIALAEARQTTFESNSKLLITSSPLDPGDATDQQFDRGTREAYLVPCPNCGHHHELVVEHFRYERDPDNGFMARAWFVCPECGADIDESHKAAMLRDELLGGTAYWHAASSGDGETLSFHVSAFYAPVGSVSWLKLARELAHARVQHERGNPQPLQVFYNTRLALSWTNTEEQTTAQQLQARAELAPRVVPDWALVVTMAADTQINRIEAQVEAWGPGLQHAVIDHHVFIGSPTIPPDDPSSPWHKLDEYRRTPWAHASGVPIYASVYAVDSGGANTQDVYNYGSARVQHGCLVVKGASAYNKPIISSAPSKADIDWQGKRVEGGVLLWTIGTDTAKDHLHNRMRLTEGWGSMHFATSLDLGWFEQLLAEAPKRKRTSGGIVRRVWVKRNEGDRNEALDMAVYNLACAHHLGLHKWSAQDWQRLRMRLGVDAPRTPDLLVQPSAASESARVAAQLASGADPAHAVVVPPPAPQLPPTAAAPPRARRLISRGQY